MNDDQVNQRYYRAIVKYLRDAGRLDLLDGVKIAQSKPPFGPVTIAAWPAGVDAPTREDLKTYTAAQVDASAQEFEDDAVFAKPPLSEYLFLWLLQNPVRAVMTEKAAKTQLKTLIDQHRRL